MKYLYLDERLKPQEKSIREFLEAGFSKGYFTIVWCPAHIKVEQKTNLANHLEGTKCKAALMDMAQQLRDGVNHET